MFFFVMTWCTSSVWLQDLPFIDNWYLGTIRCFQKFPCYKVFVIVFRIQVQLDPEQEGAVLLEELVGALYRYIIKCYCKFSSTQTVLIVRSDSSKKVTTTIECNHIIILVCVTFRIFLTKLWDFQPFLLCGKRNCQNSVM